MKKIFLLLTLLMLALLGGCTSSIHMSQVDIDSNYHELDSYKVIEIEESQKNMLGFVFHTDYVDQAYTNLLRQCPNGTAIINVEYLTNHGFLSWTDIIRIKAICR
ncbi:hypothetical protein CMT41_07640 [Colwellia sp. MT41]|nr:hypothetical protein CMT41_07640 [Colwellia sp. MT41]